VENPTNDREYQSQESSFRLQPQLRVGAAEHFTLCLDMRLNVVLDHHVLEADLSELGTLQC
jgi:hypothetical protein